MAKHSPTEIGPKAFANAEAVATPSEQLPEYLLVEGVPAVDVAVPEYRAARLMELLSQETAPAPLVRRGVPLQLTEADEFYDELDAAELLELLEEEGADLELDE